MNDFERLKKEDEFRNAVKTMLLYIGEDPTREALKDTPERVRKAWLEWFQGYSQDPADMFTTFKDDTQGYDQIIILRDIPYYSHCIHHIAPYQGVAHIGYVPADGVVIGVSKLSRILDLFAKRMTIQEELTKNTADCLVKLLNPLGVAVVLEGVHSCTTTRGINKQGQTMITSAMRGVFKEKPEARAEFMALIK